MHIKAGGDTANTQWISAISLFLNLSPSPSPSFLSHTFISPWMPCHWLQERSICISLPLCLRTHMLVHVTVSVNVCASASVSESASMCLSVCEYALETRHVYLLTSVSRLCICMFAFGLLSLLVQQRGTCARVFVFWHVLLIVKTRCSLAKHLHAVRHAAYSRDEQSLSC